MMVCLKFQADVVYVFDKALKGEKNFPRTGKATESLYGPLKRYRQRRSARNNKISCFISVSEVAKEMENQS